MRHSDFIKQLSNRLDIKESEVSSLLRVNPNVDPMSIRRKMVGETATIIPIKEFSVVKPVDKIPLSETAYFTADKNNQTTLSRKTFQMEENEPTYIEKHPYFEWIVISLFLIILAAGLYLIKPSTTPLKEFSTQPFEFTDIPVKDKIATSKMRPTEVSGNEFQPVQQQEAASIETTPAPH